MLDKEKLYGWIFHYNPFRNKWEVVYKDHYHDLFNGGNYVLRHTSRKYLETLILTNDKRVRK